MHFLPKLILTSLALTAAGASLAQVDENEQLKIAALEALMAAPAERALPLASKALSGNHSDEVKMRALFVLSQIDVPEAQALLLETAQNSDSELRYEAIRMIGIGGDAGALAGLTELYASGDMETKESVLQAYMIADDRQSVFEIATNAASDEEFEAAVNMLGAMGANEELRQLRDRAGDSESLIHAYAISGDSESLRELALDGSNPERQIQAIQGLGIAGGDAGTTLEDIYRGTDSADVKRAALNGMLVAGHDQGVLDLFRASQDAQEKRELLQTLVMMDSDAAMQVIDEALGDGQ